MQLIPFVIWQKYNIIKQLYSSNKEKKLAYLTPSLLQHGFGQEWNDNESENPSCFSTAWSESQGEINWGWQD